MSHFLLTATNQEIFDAAYMGLKSQGFKKCMDETGDKCMYDDGLGHHCAIGWVFALSRSACSREGYSVRNQSFWSSIGVNVIDVPWKRQEFLIGLQAIHDTMDDIKKGMEDFAANRGLTVPDLTLPVQAQKVLETV